RNRVYLARPPLPGLWVRRPPIMGESRGASAPPAEGTEQARAPMGYSSLRECVADLERTGQLVRIEQEIDPFLEAAEVQRRVYRAGGPAVFFARVKGCAFPLVGNLF